MRQWPANQKGEARRFGDFPERATTPGFSPRASCARLCDDSGVAGRIVIVDDNDGFRSLARAVLEADGFAVVGEAADAAGTLPAVAEAQPDIVLLDIQLPDGNGLDLVEQIAGLDGSPAVVLVSSREASDFGTRIESSRARGFILKSRLSGPALAALLS